MPDLVPDERTHADDPEHWLTGQLEFIDQQLSNYAHNRARHRQDVVLYARVQAHLPMRYHMTQVEQCTARIEGLLDLRLRVVARAQEGGGTDEVHPMHV